MMGRMGQQAYDPYEQVRLQSKMMGRMAAGRPPIRNPEYDAGRLETELAENNRKLLLLED